MLLYLSSRFIDMLGTNGTANNVLLPPFCQSVGIRVVMTFKLRCGYQHPTSLSLQRGILFSFLSCLEKSFLLFLHEYAPAGSRGCSKNPQECD